MGATVSLLTAGRRPDLVRSLALLEPVILTPGQYSTFDMPGAPYLMRSAFPLARQAKRRRAQFISREVAFETLKGRGFFKGFSDETLRNYLQDGLVDDSEGGVRLACTPAWEQATFAAQRQDPWSALIRAPKTIVILRAEHGSSLSKQAPQRIKSIRPDVRLATVEGATHALPMERPDRARAAIETAAMTATKGAFADIA